MPEATLSPNQRQTRRAREVFAAQFPTPEARSDFYRQIGERGNAGRLTLPADDAAALRRAYELLRSIAHKFPATDDDTDG